MTINRKGQEEPTDKDIGQLPIKQVKRRFFLLLTLAFILIAVLMWLTLAVLDVNDIEPFGELAAAQFTPLVLSSFV